MSTLSTEEEIPSLVKQSVKAAVIADRIAGMEYTAIGTKHGITAVRARYICRGAMKRGEVSAEAIGYHKVRRDVRYTHSEYDKHWLLKVWSRTRVSDEGCWIWQGFVHPRGYGSTNYRQRGVRVHRKVYEIVHGVVLGPDELVCHSCDNRPCCNPAHLWIGDAHANSEDSGAKGRHWASQITHCPQGHEYTPANTYVTPHGTRSCKLCARVRGRIANGWPRELAESMPVTPHGYRVVKKG